MAMSAATLSKELGAMGIYNSEVEATQAWAQAFTNYFSTAVCGIIAVVPAALAPAQAAMSAAMGGYVNDGTDAIEDGITAFWVSVGTNLATIFPGAPLPVTPPPGLGSLSADLEEVFKANSMPVGCMSRQVTLNAIAARIHADNSGGTVGVFPGPVTPIT